MQRNEGSKDSSVTMEVDKNKANSTWGGRFQESTDAFVAEFTASVGFDQRMADEDISGSLAHAEMLASVGVLNEEEFAQIRQGLGQIRDEIKNGSFAWSVALEDVHMNI